MNTGPPKGALDAFGDRAAHLEALVASLRDRYRRFGYEHVAPPIIESAGPFLDRSGEQIRQEMYMFSDPSERELCLRPELTIPTARLYAHNVLGTRPTYRAFYVGPVFRYGATGDGRYRQFTQAGVELFGEADVELGDAEILALAQESMRACGLEGFATVVSDIGFFRAAAADVRLGRDHRRAIERAASDPGGLAETILRLAEPRTPSNPDAPVTSIEDALAQVPEAVRLDLVRSLVGLNRQEQVGGRGPDEIADRLVARVARRQSEPLDRAVAQLFDELLAIDAPLPEGLARIEELVDRSPNLALSDRLESWRRRVRLMEAHGVDTASVRLDLRLRRGIDYYSSFIFEIHDDSGSSVSQLCAGGRYDDLVANLSGRSSASGVGFALGVERVARLAPRVRAEPVEVMVVHGGDVDDEECVRTATALRAQGLRVGLLPGRRVRYAIKAALKVDVRFLVIVGEEELTSDEVILRDLQLRSQRQLRFAEVAAAVSRASEGDPT